VQKFASVVQDNAGNALANPTVTVTLAGTGTLASIFSTNTFTVLANPFTGNIDGTYAFYAGDGRYDVVVTKTGFTFTAAETSDIVLHDPFSTITPTALAINTNDYNPSNAQQASLWRLSASAPINLTGIIAPLFNGITLTLVNVGASTITVTNQDAASLAANRIITGTGGSVSVAADGSMTLAYDLTTTRWRKIV